MIKLVPISETTPEDFQKFNKLSSRESLFNNHHSLSAIKDFYKKIEEDDLRDAWFFTDQGQIVAELFFTIHEGFLFLNKISVLKAYRGKTFGLATKLMDKAKDVAKEHDLAMVILTVASHNETAIAFYRREGFTEQRPSLSKHHTKMFFIIDSSQKDIIKKWS